MNRDILQAIAQERLIVIVRGVERQKLLPLTEAMYRGGVRLLEVTYSANGSVPDEETAACISMLCANFRDRMHIGAGTVLTERQVELTAQAGGRFVISPDCNPTVIQKTKQLHLVSIPGAFSPTEAQVAHRAGADLVKLFPTTSLGTEYIKAICAPLSHIPLLAVGGIDLDNIGAYLKAGVLGVGIGSGIINKKMLVENDYEGITELARRYVQAAKE